MTEAELRAVKPFDTLPLVDTDSAEAEEMTRAPLNPKYQGPIFEASDLDELAQLMANPKLVPQGAYRDDDGTIRAIFWELR